MEKMISHSCTAIINRPIGEVRAQFCDVRYHATHTVHPEITFNIDGMTDEQCRYRTSIKIAGVTQSDIVQNTILPNGDLNTAFLEGMNKGGTLMQSFRPHNERSTEVTLQIDIPVKGARVLLFPLLSAGTKQALERGLLQDKADLEAGNYTRYAQSANQAGSGATAAGLAG